MQVSNLSVPAKDGFKLAATLYEPVQPRHISMSVIIFPATGVLRRYYDKYARYLCNHGFVVLTFDYRGVGDSRPATLNKFKAFMRDWGINDIAGTIDWMCGNYPQTVLVAVGHSVAGQVFGLAENNARVSRILLVGSQSGYWRLWHFPRKLSIFLLWYLVIPVSSILLSYFPAKVIGLGENLPAGVALEWAKWGRDRRYILGNHGMREKANFQNFTGPMRLYSISDDNFSSDTASEALLAFYPNANKERRNLLPRQLGEKQIGHFGFFKEKFRDKLWPETVQWLSLAE